MNIRYRFKDYLNLPTHTVLGISLPNWFHLLWKNKFAVSLVYVPKVIFITCVVLLNAPLQLIEYLRFHKRIKQTPVAPPVFILGHPRSGTTHLQYVLSKDPAFAFCTTAEGLLPHMFLTAGKFSEYILKAAMPATRPQDNVKAGATLPVEEEFAMGNISHTSWVHGLYFPKNIYAAVDEYVTFKKSTHDIKQHWQIHFDYLMRKLSLKYDGKTLLLKSPANTGRLKELYELYPAAKFIHIHRHPFDVYLSTERLYEKILPLIGFQKVKSEFIRKHILYAYKEILSKYLHDRSLIPTRQLIEIRYDDFVKVPIDEMKKIYRKLDLTSYDEALPFFMEELHSTKDYVANRYEKMDASLKKEIIEHWGFAFEAFGYSV